MLQKFFFVGVGGSGGVTVRVLRDLLAARLVEAGYHDGIPAAWQFAHVDVPLSQGSRPEDVPMLPDNQYIGLADEGLRYRHVHDMMTHNPQAARHAVAWQPDPARVNVDPAVGGGRFRAIGRVVMGARMIVAQERLRTGFAALHGESANQEFSRVCLALTGDGRFSTEDPQVVVVSSLAGGSGAGFVSDVCDLLLQLEPSAEERLAAVLYTPEVFEELQPRDRVGINPNALAALSELLNGYWVGQAPSADEFAFISAAQAFSNPDIRRRGPRIMYLVGRSNGSVTFSGQNDVYRAVGRGLAVWTTTPELQVRFREHEVGNWSDRAQNKADESGLCDAQQERPVSSFGCASVGIGLDRFARYSAERLARTTVEHLLNGHWTVEDRERKVTEETARERNAEKSWREFLSGCGLEEDGPYRNQIIDAIRGDRTEAQARERIGVDLQATVLQEVTANWPARPPGAAVVAARIEQRMLAQWLEFLTGYQQEYLNKANAWAAALQDRVAAGAATLVAREGARVAHTVLRRCVHELTGTVVPELENDRDRHKRYVGELNARVQGSLAGITGGLQPGNPRIGAAVSIALDSFAAATEELVHDLAAALTLDVAENLLGPLRRAVEEAAQRLEIQLRGTSVRASRIETWPLDSTTVPPRYVPAPNELLLEPVDRYPTRYEQLISAQVGITAFHNALDVARREVIDGTREAPDGLQVVVRSPGRWQARDRRLPQGSGARAAQFTVHIDDEELLGRARTWIRRGDTAMGDFLDQKLTHYLDAGAPDEQTRADRLEDFRRQLAQAVAMSRPLVDIDRPRENRIHPGARSGFREELTPFPFPKGHPAREAVRSVFSHYPDHQLARLYGPRDRERIDLFTFLDAPVQPVVLSSFVDPIRRQWDRDRTQAGMSGFWTWRRAKPLPSFVPCAPEVRAAIVRGWFVARFLNQIRCRNDDVNREPTQVWTPDGGVDGWAAFSCPLLGPPVTTTDEWLPAVLESLVLTLVNEPFLPYGRLADLGRSVLDVGPGEFTTWITTGRPAEHAPAPLADLAGPGDAAGTTEERVKVLLDTLETWQHYYAGYDEWPLRGRSPSRAWEIRGDIRSALSEIRDVVNRSADRGFRAGGIG